MSGIRHPARKFEFLSTQNRRLSRTPTWLPTPANEVTIDARYLINERREIVRVED
jgi:hypothetical protein